MKIIGIEGIDKAGKATTCNLLKFRLEHNGYKVMKSEHHRYDTPTGELIMKWLTGQWNVSQKTIELIMSADKQAQQEWFKEIEQMKYDFLILDRYMLSQMAYAVANGVDSQWVVQLQRYMRKPDIDIVIDIPADISMSRKGKHNGGNNDRYESDLDMLNRVRDNYKYMSRSSSAPIKYIVNGLNSIEAIHEEIFQIVQNEFGLRSK